MHAGLPWQAARHAARSVGPLGVAMGLGLPDGTAFILEQVGLVFSRYSRFFSYLRAVMSSLSTLHTSSATLLLGLCLALCAGATEQFALPGDESPCLEELGVSVTRTREKQR